MTQIAKLCFRDYTGTKLISGVSQLENEGTHILLDGANDFVGRSSSDRVDLLAPYDCVVKAIATYDNTVFFQSLDKVLTPSGEFDHCWFMCTHILDSDLKTLGIVVGKQFKQGQPCYTEGTKGIGSGNHIHMEQGYGVFGGGSSPYYKSSDTFVYNGKTYTQYYPVLGPNSKECHIAQMMFLDEVEVVRGQNTKKGLPDYYQMRLAPTNRNEKCNQVYVNVSALRVRAEATTSSLINGYCEQDCYYDVLNVITKSDYTWYQVGPQQFLAGVDGVKYLPAVEDKKLMRFNKDEATYRWSVDGNAFGQPYDITSEKGFGDTQLVKEDWEELLCVNGSLFYTYDGAHYAEGIEKSRGINNQPVEMSCVSNYNTCMSVGCTYDGKLVFDTQINIIDNLDNYYGAITGLGLILNGEKRNDLHKGFESQWNCKSGRTVIGIDRDGNFLSYSFAGETGKSGLTCKQLQDKCINELGFYSAIALDGGGSVFRRYRNEQNKLIYDISTSRKVKNALLLYRKKNSQPQPPTPDPIPEPTDDIEKLKKQVEELTILLNDANEQILEDNKIISSLNEKVEMLEQKQNVLENELNESNIKYKESTDILHSINELTDKY